jgi:Fe-S cluster assembly ATP-binding protein
MLAIKNLSVSIEEKPIITNLCLQIKPGSTHAIMGPNGSGKSTLAYTLMGHPSYQITAGSITFNGVDLATLSPDKRANLGIFLAFQQPCQIPGVSIITFLKEIYQARHKIIISLKEFQALLNAYLEQLCLDSSFMYRALNEGFSGGEKKKFELLQCLLLKPSLAIFDEIDSGLDVDALNIVAQAINTLREQNPAMTVLIITHYPPILNEVIPDAIHIMKSGTLALSGSADLAHRIQAGGYDACI